MRRFHAERAGGPGNGGEIDVGGDVGATGVGERVVGGAVGAECAQGAVAAGGVVEFGVGESVIEEKKPPAREQVAQRSEEPGEAGAQFGAVPGGETLAKTRGLRSE
jgi:hypothetical protein